LRRFDLSNAGGNASKQGSFGGGVVDFFGGDASGFVRIESDCVSGGGSVVMVVIRDSASSKECGTSSVANIASGINGCEALLFGVAKRCVVSSASGCVCG
jgi:hypothetical protein